MRWRTLPRNEAQTSMPDLGSVLVEPTLAEPRVDRARRHRAPAFERVGLSDCPTDWSGGAHVSEPVEVAEDIVESYRVLAPEKLTALLD
jgi:hypothetical protein